MLGLKLATDPRWVNIAEKNMEDILIDHAFCEQKAASSCISLIVRYPEKEKLVDTLMPIVTEEWGHFRMVLKELKKRGLRLSHKRSDDYVVSLRKLIRKGSANPDDHLLDELLINALVEARSCERFRLLSEQLEDEDLRQFYHELMISEAGHYTTFVKLAEEYLPKETVRKRLEALLAKEAEIMEHLATSGTRVH